MTPTLTPVRPGFQRLLVWTSVSVIVIVIVKSFHFCFFFPLWKTHCIGQQPAVTPTPLLPPRRLFVNDYSTLQSQVLLATCLTSLSHRFSVACLLCCEPVNTIDSSIVSVEIAFSASYVFAVHHPCQFVAQFYMFLNSHILWCHSCCVLWLDRREEEHNCDIGFISAAASVRPLFQYGLYTPFPIAAFFVVFQNLGIIRPQRGRDQAQESSPITSGPNKILFGRV